MAFVPSASTVTLTAKLTPYGRQQLLANTNSIISHFSLGDSDANYRATGELEYGDVPSTSGNIGPNSGLTNSVASNVTIKNKIIVNSLGEQMKPVEVNSNQINTTSKNLGVQTVDETHVRGFVMDRTQSLTDPLTNLFSSFGLPITEIAQAQYTDVTDASGGFSNTALKWLNQNKVLVISLDGADYGEMLDGRVFKIEIATIGQTYTLYSTYQRSLTPLAVQDTKTSEISAKANLIANNIAFLVSDEIQKPGNNLLKSWGTGFNTVKPFSVNKKELFNLVNNVSTSTQVDTVVGAVYLDKGIVVVTYPDIVNNYLDGDSITVTFDSIITEVSQDVTCIVNRGEFVSSNNVTYNTGDMIRVSEVGLHDTDGNLMAIAKTNKHILVGANQFMALGIKIVV